MQYKQFSHAESNWPPAFVFSATFACGYPLFLELFLFLAGLPLWTPTLKPQFEIHLDLIPVNTMVDKKQRKRLANCSADYSDSDLKA